MNASVNVSDFARELSIVSRALSPRAVLPVLENFLFDFKDNQLVIAATNLECGIASKIVATVDQPWSTTVPGKTILDIVSTLEGVITMTFEPKTQTIKMVCGKNKSTIKCIDAQEFPPFKDFPANPIMTLNGQELKRNIGRVVIAAATDDSRPVLTCVNFKTVDTMLKISAADGFRLAELKYKLPQPLKEDIDYSIPAVSIRELAKVIGDSAGNVSITPGQGAVAFHIDHRMIFIQRVDSNFPDTQRIIPSKFGTTFVAEIGPAVACLKQARVFTADSSRVTFKVKQNDPVIISAESEQCGNTSSELPAVSTGDEVSIHFNIRFMLDAIENGVKGDSHFSMKMGGPTGACLITSSDGSDEYLYVAMPMQLS